MKYKARPIASGSRRKKISFRLLMSHIGVSLVPIMAMGFLFYFTSLDIIQQKAGESTLDKLSNISAIVDLKVESVISYMKLFRSNAEINRLLQEDFETYQYNDVSKVIDNFQSMIIANPAIKTVIVSTRTDHLYRGGEYSNFDFESVSDRVLSDLAVSGESYFDLGLQERASFSQNGRYVVALAMAIKNYSDMSDLGVLFADLSPELLFDVIFKEASGREIVVLDKSLNAVINSDHAQTDQLWRQDDIKTKTSGQAKGYFRYKIQGADSLVVFFTSRLTGWTYIEYYPISNISAEMNTLSKVLILAIVGMVFIVWSMSNYISHQISKPINELTSLMTQVENGDFNVSIAVRREDDIGRLGRGFNTMVARINELIQTIYQQEQKKKEIEIEVLQAQINPHFLYNTLNSIKWMAIIHGVDSITDMTDSLIQLLKLSLGKYGTMIELQQELKMLKQYVSILNVRYNNGISLKYDMPDSLKSARIPRLILQPLVENAIIHGIESTSMQGKIFIQCSAANGDLIISVQDNGKGIKKEDLDELNNGNHDRRSLNNIGVSNINERIKLYYGEEYGLVIRSDVGEGTTAVVTMPLTLTDAENNVSDGGNDHDTSSNR